MKPVQHLPLSIPSNLVVLGLFFVLAGLRTVSGGDLDPELADRVDRLLRRLNDAQATQRDEAEQELLSLAPSDPNECDAFLLLLPEPLEGMPAEVRLRLSRVRRQIESQQADQALVASRVTLDGEEMELSAIFDEIKKQTGNLLVDYRDQFGQDAAERRVAVKIDDEEFWPAIDKILDAAEMSLYPFSEEESLGVINREENVAPRGARASYAGPFRVEAVKVSSRRGLRSANQQGASLELEFSWEPRLRPIALSQPADALQIVGDDGSPIEVRNPETIFDVEVQPGSHTTELTIALMLPPRTVSKIASFKGQLSALVPGRTVEFRFDGLGKKRNEAQQRGGVEVTLSGARKNQDLWEIHMRLKVESKETGLDSNRGWVFQNPTYLLDKNNEIVDHAGFETTMQSENEIGVAYFFELPDEIGNYTWVYRTPAALVRVPVEYELKEIPLP